MEIDKYTKRILTAMAIGLFVNAGVLIYQAKLIDKAEDRIWATNYQGSLIKSTVNEINKTLGEIKRNDGDRHIVREILNCIDGSTLEPDPLSFSKTNNRLSINIFCKKQLHEETMRSIESAKQERAFKEALERMKKKQTER